jgi:hypothetical protein
MAEVASEMAPGRAQEEWVRGAEVRRALMSTRH